MRKTCLDEVYGLARRDERVLFIGSDLGSGTLDAFKEEFPDRFFMEGISEAALIGMAAGLAMEGNVPYVNTIATFIARRAYEQVAVDVCLHDLNVRLIANGGGLVYAPLGPTHEATDDIAVMRALPNMTILVPADADEMRRLMPLTLDHAGPIYIRVAKGFDPIVTRDDLPVTIGKALSMIEGREALLITTGITLGTALEASRSLSGRGVRAGVLHMPTVKPLDRETLLDAAADAEAVLTIEEHSIVGGLGSAVAEVLAEARLGATKRFKRLGLPDAFPDRYGSQASLLERFDLTPDAVVAATMALLEA